MTSPAVPLNDLGRYASRVSRALGARAQAVLESGYFVLGPNVAAFEAEFAAYCGVGGCVGVANGTDALELALRACGISSGDGVVMCANAAMYGATAALAIGAVPVFADVDRHGLLTVATVADAIGDAPAPPRALIVTHLYGRLADMAALVPLARAHGLRIVEDCAQAHGARAPDGTMAGASGDAGAFSFYPTKNLGAVGDGGAVISNDAGLLARVRQLRQYGWSSKYCNELRGGRNSRLDEIQAAFLRVLLEDLDARNARRSAIADHYTQSITNPAIQLPDACGSAYVAHLYVVRSEHRDALAAHLADAGIMTDVHYPVPDYRQPALVDSCRGVSLAGTELACAQSLTLPCFPELHDDERDAVVSACNAWVAP